MQWFLCATIMLITLFTIASIACWFAARLSADSIISPLLALRRQIDCLKSHDIVVCALPPHAITRETAMLSEGVASLRAHFDETTVPKETLLNVHGWYWEIFSELLAILRQRVSLDSPLIEGLSDYALLLQTIRGDILPPPQPLNLAHILNAALAAARASLPPRANVNLTASLSPNLRGQWSGQPEVLGTLLRHLLLIGLKRTHSGFVCLRLEAHLHDHASPRLRISFEDSGPFIQHWQLQQWLISSKDDIHTADMVTDISWLLATRLFKRLDGTLSGASAKEGGLSLEGNLPLLPYIADTDLVPAPDIFMSAHNTPPLVLVVENDKENLKTIEHIFAQAGSEVFIVYTHMQALEWAAVLPFSAIMLNAAVSDVNQDITRRLRHMAEDGAMPNIPLWISTVKFSFIDFDYWRQQGITELLLKPYSIEMLTRLVGNLAVYDEAFYLVHNQNIRQDVASAGIAFSDMSHMLGTQILQIEPVLQMLANNTLPKDGRDRPHTVRSAALTLGYFRLAALMGHVEHACVLPAADIPARNWKIVAQVLKSLNFENLGH